ncbi:carbohydrate ABC transporter permease [Antribacter sp. KLBMP9083]|uniref:Carbohydrate ABC transporter permease n=1 Tax=Antribacter soli TaxID=2910976 RepID=A0AA41QBB9_9MICO|nr:carbohydrate ABC transporter permease [Antribacter soli]MCF4120318.1 carbohydrate ABC transporter permease [Antribacter soli]
MSETTSHLARPQRVNREFTRWSRNDLELRALGVLRRVVIGALLLVAVFPFLYVGVLSTRDIASLQRDPARFWPNLDEVRLDAYVDVLLPYERGGQDFANLMLNSALIAVSTVAVTLLVAVPASYAVSRLEFLGRRQISALFLAVYLFPGILLAVPLFVAFTRMGLRGNIAVLVVVYVSQTVAVAIFMLRNYFRTVPVALEEAAALDGLGRLGIIRRITLPLSLPAIVSNALFVFMIAWNEFLFALLFLVEDRDVWTVSLGLAQLTNALETPPATLMAGSIVLTVPVVAIFFASERFLAGGLTSGAEKG